MPCGMGVSLSKHSDEKCLALGRKMPEPSSTGRGTQIQKPSSIVLQQPSSRISDRQLVRHRTDRRHRAYRRRVARLRAIRNWACSGLQPDRSSGTLAVRSFDGVRPSLGNARQSHKLTHWSIFSVPESLGSTWRPNRLCGQKNSLGVHVAFGLPHLHFRLRYLQRERPRPLLG